MSPQALTAPERLEVTRTELRRKPSALLRRAKGRTVVAVRDSRAPGDTKYVLDGRYLEELWRNLRAAIETLEILKDRRLLNQLLRATRTLDQEAARGRLRSLEDAFGAN